MKGVMGEFFPGCYLGCYLYKEKGRRARIVGKREAPQPSQRRIAGRSLAIYRRSRYSTAVERSSMARAPMTTTEIDAP